MRDSDAILYPFHFGHDKTHTYYTKFIIYTTYGNVINDAELELHVLTAYIQIYEVCV